MTAAEAYLAAKEVFVETLAPLDDRHRVDATPDWDAHALLSHVAGLAVDVTSGRLEGYSKGDWTAAQVAARAGSDRATVLEEWSDATPTLVALLEDPQGVGLPDGFAVLPVTDLVAHLHDLRESTGVHDIAVPGAWEVVEPRRREVLTLGIALTSAPTLHVCTEDGDEWVVGDGEPAGRVSASRYELWRSLEGRRTRDRVRAFDWSVDATPYLDRWIAPAFSWPE